MDNHSSVILFDVVTYIIMMIMFPLTIAATARVLAHRALDVRRHSNAHRQRSADLRRPDTSVCEPSTAVSDVTDAAATYL